MARTISGARPSDGSSRSSSRGRAMRRPPDRQHLLFTSRQGTGELALPLPESGEETEHRVELAFRPARASRVRAPISRFSRTVRLGKTCRPSGTCASPRSTTRRGDRPARDPPEPDAPGPDGKQPRDRPQGGGLPGAVRPDERDASPPPDVQGDRPDGQEVAVPGGHALKREHGFLPQVGLDDPRVGGDGGRGPLGDDPTLAQHHDAMGERHDGAHHVLDEQDRDALPVDLTA